MSSPAASFYFDLASPLAYLAAERILHVFPWPAEWTPVLACELAGAETPPGAGGAPSQDDSSPARERPDDELLRAQVERRAGELGLQPVRWPEPFPFDSSLAMRVATYAASIGRAVPFAQAAFRQAFAGGHSLENPDFVLIAAAACEMHPTAVLRAAQTRAVQERLTATTATAASIGLREVPALVVPLRGRCGEQVFVGERELERAATFVHAKTDGSQGAWANRRAGAPSM